MTIAFEPHPYGVSDVASGAARRRSRGSGGRSVGPPGTADAGSVLS